MTEKLLNYFNGDELAANVWLNKYAQEGDETPNDMHKRMAKEFAKIENKYIKEEKQIEENYQKDLYFYYKENGVKFNPLTKLSILSQYGQIRKDLNEETIYNLFKDFKYIIPQGSIMATLGTNQIASLSNCWVIESPLDSYGAIHKADGDLINYYKRRGGVGIDISNLRPTGVTTNNAAKTSTGAISFMHRFSNTTKEVGMNGRRAALMISIDINHPDVMEFIKIKRDLSQITGANISIKLNDKFMKAVEKDDDYLLRFPCNVYDKVDKSIQLLPTLEYNELVSIPEALSNGVAYIKKIKAKEYWDEIIKSAKNYAEPGLMFWDNILDYDPSAVYKKYKPISSNPCGEQYLNSNDSCRLLAINLYSFVTEPFTKNASFDYKKLYEYIYEALRLGDNLIDLEAEYIDRIFNKIINDPEPLEIKQQELKLWKVSKENAINGRRIGLGITALGDTLAALGLKYDSKEALDIVKKIMYWKLKSELDCTTDLAILRGTFDGWDNNLEFTDYKIKENLFENKGNNFFYSFINTNFVLESKRMQKYGRRNLSWSTVKGGFIK